MQSFQQMFTLEKQNWLNFDKDIPNIFDFAVKTCFSI